MAAMSAKSTTSSSSSSSSSPAAAAMKKSLSSGDLARTAVAGTTCSIPPEIQAQWGGKTPDVMWQNRHFTASEETYQKLLDLCCKNLPFLLQLCRLTRTEEADLLARCFTNILTLTGGLHTILEVLIRREFERATPETSGSLFRGNSILTKIQTCYVRHVGRAFLKRCLGPPLASVIRDTDAGDLDLEIHPNKLPKDAADPAALAAARSAKIMDVAQAFLDRITSDEMVEAMPRQIRAIAGYTAKHGARFLPNDYKPLVGGFLMLRIFNPAIVAPESLDLLPDDTPVPSVKARRNLILISKVLQNISNNVRFGSKEEYMVSLNECVDRNQAQVQDYFSRAAQDPLLDPQGREWVAVDPQRPVRVREIQLHDLYTLHRLLFNQLPKIQKELQAVAAKSGSTGQIGVIVQDFSAHLESLGAPPFARQSKPKPDTVDVDLIEAPGAGGAAGSSSGDVALFDKAKWLYVGKPNKASLPVVYCIVNRIREEFVTDKAEQLILYIQHTLKDVVQKRYALVIDMSWARITAELRDAVWTNMAQIQSFDRGYKKNLGAVYIVHPTTFTKALTFGLRSFTSGKLQKKIFEIHNWQDLDAHIQTDSIMLPESSRDFITKAYKVQKVNSKGKAQSRILKFTATSILNIEPGAKLLKNEKPLSEITTVFCWSSSNEIHLRFAPPGGASASAYKGSLDKVYRRYVANSKEERDEIIEDLFMTGFNLSQVVGGGRLFKVLKSNPSGKQQPRNFLLTCDSLLNLDGTEKIKTEISFAGIEEVTIDAKDRSVVWLKFKSEERPRKIVCKDAAQQLVLGLRDAIKRYRYQEAEGYSGERRATIKN